MQHHWVLACVYALASVSCVGSLFVVVSFYVHRELRELHFVLVRNLALSDFGYALVKIWGASHPELSGDVCVAEAFSHVASSTISSSPSIRTSAHSRSATPLASGLSGSQKTPQLVHNSA